MDEDELIAAVLGASDEFDSDKTAEERRLEQIVLGGAADFEHNLDSAVKKVGFSEERQARSSSAVDDEDQPKAAWHDEDDDDNLVAVQRERRFKRYRTDDERTINADLLSKRLRAEYEKNIPVPTWAQKSTTAEDSPSDILIRSTGSYVEKSAKRLPLKNFRFKKLTSLNFESPGKGFIHSVQFHPKAQLALVASFGRTVDLFQVDGKSNPKVQSIYFERFPVSCAGFLNGGEKILVSSKLFPHMFSYELRSQKTTRIPWNKSIPEEGFHSFQTSPDNQLLAFPGKDGNIQIFSQSNVEWIHSLKMNGSVAAVAFSHDSKSLYSIGDAGLVYVWDLRTRKCVSTFMDDGCVSGTAIAASVNGEYLAVGSNTGITNFYDAKTVHSSKPTLLKAISNLTSCVTSLKFNPSSEILAMGSNYDGNALKLFHTAELQVIPTFPAVNQQIRQPECMDFSVNSGYFALGNNKGEAQLFRLFDYKGY